jgi:hypothetical protein
MSTAGALMTRSTLPLFPRTAVTLAALAELQGNNPPAIIDLFDPPGDGQDTVCPGICREHLGRLAVDHPHPDSP